MDLYAETPQPAAQACGSNGSNAMSLRTVEKSPWRNSPRTLVLLVLAGLAAGIGPEPGEVASRASITEARARSVETRALSSVAGSVPGREAARRAQAAAIMEAQKMGLNISIASIGVGGRDGGFADDELAFARLSQRFPETLKAVGERGVFRERLLKAWRACAEALADGTTSNGSSQVIADEQGRAGACVVELRASDEGLRGMLIMSYDESVIEAIEDKARALGITAADVAFLVSAHESAHCVIGLARRAGLLDASWIESVRRVPASWAEARSENDNDHPALGKEEESAADILAAVWAGDVLGPHKARQLMRLAVYARAWGARTSMDDGLHDSSRALGRVLALSGSDRFFPVANATRFAWKTAVSDTRIEAP
jgi:hypothetical protein